MLCEEEEEEEEEEGGGNPPTPLPLPPPPGVSLRLRNFFKSSWARRLRESKEWKTSAEAGEREA